MAESAVESLLDNVRQLLLYHVDLIQDVRTQVQTLEDDLPLFRAFLKDIGRTNKGVAGLGSSSSSLRLKQLVKEINFVVSDMEDAIDAYIIDKTAPNMISSAFWRFSRRRGSSAPATKLDTVAEQVQALKKKVETIMEVGSSNSSIDDDPTAPRTAEVAHFHQGREDNLREDIVVGLEDEAQKIIGYLKATTDALDVIAIIGMPGLGKTTLARKVFHDKAIQDEFPTRIWVTCSQVFNKRAVLRTILKDSAINTDNLDEKIMVRKVREHLQPVKFLLVLDGLWTVKSWTELRDAIPRGNIKSKILITSRKKKVGKEASWYREPHNLRSLNEEESWKLLQLKVFDGLDSCPPELREYGERIARKCDGFPPAILMIGGTLQKQYRSGDTMATNENAWRKVSESVSSYLEKENYLEQIVALSYENLPYRFRQCFLYLGLFPEGFDIPVWALIRLWIAEGFIQQEVSRAQEVSKALEQTARDYLMELIDRNLVMVSKLHSDGQIKTCRVHGIVRKFCKNESATEKEIIFQEFTKSPETGDFMPPIDMLQTCRRVCMHSRDISDFLSLHPSGPWVRSFLCFSEEKEPGLLPVTESDSSIPAAFKLLKVLSAYPIRFTRFPRHLGRLVHLRYVVLSCDSNVIPADIAQLWNLQTLVVYTTSHAIVIKANIWKMAQLRHVMTNASAILPKPGKGKEAFSEKLHTLGRLSPKSCTEDLFRGVPNLNTLVISGSLGGLQDAKGLDKLSRLEKLKLVNKDPYDHGDMLPRLPHAYEFPPKLRWLTLDSTRLKWEHMSTVAMLDSLEVLKLKKNAFIGVCWETSAGGFLHLEVLHIEDTDLVTWEAEVDNFPKLRILLLRWCQKLEEVPCCLGDVESFEKLELDGVSMSAVESARNIDKKKKQQEERRPAAAASKRSRKFQLLA